MLDFPAVVVADLADLVSNLCGSGPCDQSVQAVLDMSGLDLVAGS